VGVKEVISKCVPSANARDNDIDLHASMDIDIGSLDCHLENLVEFAFVI